MATRNFNNIIYVNKVFCLWFAFAKKKIVKTHYFNPISSLTGT